MEAGRLRHRITIDELIVDINSDGAQVEQWWTAHRMVPAEISPLSGRELIAAQAVQSKVSTRIVIRYRPGIMPSMRVAHRGTVYNVQAVICDPASGIEWITLLCTSGVDDG
jgi:SPP1 family predicted phage head-tail adaptor